MEHHLECNSCGYGFEEPKATYTIDCPRCGRSLLIPSKKDWLEMRREIKKTTVSDV